MNKLIYVTEEQRDLVLMLFGGVREKRVAEIEAERDAALARAERLEKALKLAEGMTPPDDTPRQSEWTYVAMTWADIDAIRAAIAHPVPAEER